MAEIRFQHGSLLTGDALDLLPALPSFSVQAVIADPPYFNVLEHDWDRQWASVDEYVQWSARWITEAMRCLKDDGLFFVFGQLGKREHAFLHVMSEAARGFTYHDLIIWDRVVGYNERRDSLTPAYEMILVLRKTDRVKFRKDRVRVPYNAATIGRYLRDRRYKDKAARLRHLESGKYATNILAVPSLKGASREKCGHPSQKPIELISKLLLMSTDEGDTVLDPFLGSGTTAVAAARQGRRFIGIEISPAYVEMAKNRLEALALSPRV